MSTQINDDDDNKMEVTISTQDTETPYISSLFIERSIANARAQTHSHSILVRVFVHLAHTHTHTHVASLIFAHKAKHFRNISIM